VVVVKRSEVEGLVGNGKGWQMHHCHLSGFYVLCEGGRLRGRGSLSNPNCLWGFLFYEREESREGHREEEVVWWT
jgi:hypothetical protein